MPPSHRPMSSPGYSSARLRPRRAGLRFTRSTHPTNGPIQLRSTLDPTQHFFYSRYEPGLRSGAWQKMRVNKAQAFVIGGYTVGNPFDALVFGYYEGKRLMYVART